MGGPVDLDGKMPTASSSRMKIGALCDHVRRRSHRIRRSSPALEKVWTAAPVFFVRRGDPLFASAEEMVMLAEDRGHSLGEIALAYESELLGLSVGHVMDEMLRRFAVMESSVAAGLDDCTVRHAPARTHGRRVFDGRA